MNITQIEEIVKKLATDINASEVNKDEFIYKLMAAYGHRKTTIGRIKSGERNLANIEGEVRAKRHIYFKQSQSHCVLSDIDSMKKEPSVTRDKIRFVIATDFNQFVALDTRTHDTLDIEFNELGKHFDFFLPWAGMEKAVYQGENPADVKAAEKMAKLFDLIKADNFSVENKDDTAALHSLNVFLTRLLFCFFAEDTGIFKQNQFSAELESHTKLDGSDVDSYLNRLFDVLNTSKDTRGDLPDYLANFEYVNGGLFANNIASPRFSTKSRKMLIECGSELDWSDINPDIFGSMIQAVVHPDQRGGMGMHYTSVTNIMKVIEPLFLDELYAEFENIEDNIDAKLKPSRLRKLHDRIAGIKIFDPACGSGNFLIIAFKELRKLEMEIIKRLQELDENENQDDLFGDVGLDSSFSRIKLSQFYGIELDDFAHEVAILSLWLAEHQMNVEFKAEFGECEPTLPLQQSGNILCGNAAEIDWQDICPRTDSVFLIGNPPYIGFQNQTDAQKSEIKTVFKEVKNFKRIDYIGVWFYKAASFIVGYNSSFAFVSTNSICQGEQVRIIWPYIFSKELEIAFAYQPFNWSNNAKNKAKVTCIIVGVKAKNQIKNKIIYTNLMKKSVSNISPYLIEGSPIAIEPSSISLSNLPKMSIGNVPLDGNNFILNEEEKNELLASDPLAKNFVKNYMGASDFIKGNKRYCIWVTDETKDQALKLPFINERIERCKVFRKNGGIVARQHEKVSHRFRTQPHRETNSIIFPKTSSSRRKYIPVGFLDKNTVISEKALAAYDSEPYLFGILSSRIHVLWLSITSSRMRNDFQYSVQFSYNTFPVPKLSEEVKQKITQASIEVIETRELFPDKNLAALYDPLKMPNELLVAHENLDRIVDSIYSQESFKSDEDRLKKLFDLYSKMTGGQNA
jgi:hypothetical protein